MNQIDRLKKNRIPWKWLPVEDASFIISLNRQYILYLSGSGKWQPVGTSALDFRHIYRIHEDYEPKAPQPKFPGMVLCEVKVDERGCTKYIKDEGYKPATLAYVCFPEAE